MPSVITLHVVMLNVIFSFCLAASGLEPSVSQSLIECFTSSAITTGIVFLKRGVGKTTYIVSARFHYFSAVYFIIANLS